MTAEQEQQQPAKDHWTAKAYADSASFVPRLTSTVVAWLDPQPNDIILDVGCGDGSLTAQIKESCASITGIDASANFIEAAQSSYGSIPDLTWEVHDCRFLEKSCHFQPGNYTKVFSNAALHWILRDPSTRQSVVGAAYKALKPGGTFVFEMGGAGNVAEVHTALLAALVHHGVGIQEAREASPWFFPSETLMKNMLGKAGFTVEKSQREYRPTKLTTEDEGGIEGWVRLFGAQFLEKLTESRRTSAVREVCDALETVLTHEEDGITLERPLEEDLSVEAESDDKLMGGVLLECTGRIQDSHRLSRTDANTLEIMNTNRHVIGNETISSSPRNPSEDYMYQGESLETDIEMQQGYFEDSDEIGSTISGSPDLSEQTVNRRYSSLTADLLDWIPSSLINDVNFQAHNASPFARIQDAAVQESSTTSNADLLSEADSSRGNLGMMSRNSESSAAPNYSQHMFRRTPHDEFVADHAIRHFFDLWREQHLFQNPRFPAIGDRATQLDRVAKEIPDEVSAEDIDGERCDHQGLNWIKLGASRKDARKIRKRLYNSCGKLSDLQFSHSMRVSNRARTLPRSDNSFCFRRFVTKPKARMNHYQLRNLIAAPTRNAVFYPDNGGVMCIDTTLNNAQCVMDFSKRRQGQLWPKRITTLAAGDGVLVVGGHEGEYAVKSLFSPADGSFASAMDVFAYDGITTHIHTYLDRRGGLPQAVISSNDKKVLVLDCYTNTITREHALAWPVNCSATSPDSRLRLVVGDDTEPCIVDAESGRMIVGLERHQDFGFACDWSPNGIHMATGYQDGCVKIWDARMWDQPLFSKAIGTELGGVSSLHFSPIGGGKPVLLIAEPADIVSVVDATTFETSQQFDFFGEIGGTAFVPDGSSFYVANLDETIGGLLEYERVKGGEYGRRTAIASAYEEDEGFWPMPRRSKWSTDDDERVWSGGM
ncbi:hypothetical protein MMC13_006254 [Lambiella insularis]|nr:hypothetical protein [Lambiella insularis]